MFVSRRILFRIFIALTSTVLFYFGFSFFIKVTHLKEHVNPRAVRGYSHCQVNGSQISEFPIRYPCDFVPKPTSPNSVLIVTFVNSEWIPLAQNWILSAEKLDLNASLFVIAFEHGVCARLIGGVTCYEHPNISITGTTFSKPEYRKLVTERTRIILKLLSCWPTILLVDADISLLKNPVSYLQKITTDRDIVFQADSSGVRFVDAVLPYFFHYICGGFIYMKSNYATKLLWLSVLQYQEKFLWNDQAGLNICIRHSTQAVKWDTLDPQYFPNGRQYFHYKQHHDKNFIVHANHLEGIDKITNMIMSDVWFYDDYAIELCRDQNSWKSKQLADVCRNRYNITRDKYLRQP